MLYIETDAEQRLVASHSTPVAHTRPLKVKNPHGTVFQAYPNTETFMFAEGLASCYQQAKYAEIVVDTQGNPMLKSLVDERLKPLNCEK
ncbi:MULTISPECIES: hypothetical protein [unclassified Acinetobacter]|uniref:hypothetical protein n=1 Tax=unclassified Acinetobacter TaxID=196816 RepID=UPI0035BB99EB